MSEIRRNTVRTLGEGATTASFVEPSRTGCAGRPSPFHSAVGLPSVRLALRDRAEPL
jgi:hypothetical protein